MRKLFRGVRGIFLGLILILAVAALAGRYFRGAKSYRGPLVLEWPLGAIAEVASEDPLQALTGRASSLTLRDYLDALEAAGNDANVSGLLVNLGLEGRPSKNQGSRIPRFVVRGVANVSVRSLCTA